MIEFLDQLDEAHTKATPGPWSTRQHKQLEEGCRCLSCWEFAPGWDIDPVDGPDCPDHGCFHAIRIGQADAELIVAAVNALPRLTAAVRAALTLADELGRDAWNVCGTEASRAKADAADRLRSTVTAALAAGGAE